MEKQNTRIKIIAVIIAAALLLAACAAFGYSLALKNFEVIPDIAASENGSEISAAITNSERVKLKYTAATAADGQELTAEITARVTPEGASGVEWTLSWESAGETADISEYAYLEPNGLSVTVHVTAPFKDKNMIVTAKTEIGGFTATCRLRYEGIPTMTLADNGEIEWNTDNEWGVPIAVLYAGREYDLRFELNSVFGGEYAAADVEIVSGQAHGEILASVMRYVSGEGSGGAETVDISEIPVFGEGFQPVEQIRVPGSWLGEPGVYGATGALNASVGITGDKIGFSCNSAIENFYFWLDVDLVNMNWREIKAMENAEMSEEKPLYIELIIRDKNTGATCPFRFTVVSAVQGVEIAPTEIVF